MDFFLANLPDFDWTLVLPEARILVAASGGADSQALLWALHAAERQIVVAHINHGWRKESDDDERFVLDFCATQNIEAVGLKVRCARTEDAARVARYAALLKIALNRHCSLLAVGHTATDSLETMLLNLSRGASVQGLAGIPPSRVLDEEVQLVRPLWRTPRETARRALKAAAWPHVEDASNASPEFARNRVRAALGQLENLETLAANAARSGAILRDDLTLLDELALEALTRLEVRSKGGVLALDGDGFRGQPVALQRRVLRVAAAQLGCILSFEPIETARRHIAARGRRIVWCWEKGVRCEWTGEAAGNRVRMWRVGLSDEQEFKHK
jgi:tRNA(Ile)-lysidine synthase